MTDLPVFGAGIWHFATYKDRYATDGYGPPVGLLEQIDRAGAVGDLSVVDLNWPFAGFDGTLDDVKDALKRNNLKAIAITPGDLHPRLRQGLDHQPGPRRPRAGAWSCCIRQRSWRRTWAATYVKLWLGQDGWDYPFQVELPRHLEPGAGRPAGARLRAPGHQLRDRVQAARATDARSSSRTSPARCSAIEQIGLRQPRASCSTSAIRSTARRRPADAAQLAIDYGRLFAIDVNDNLRGWDDDMVVGSVHLVETFEFFHTLRKNNWEGVWQLDQFPFREDSGRGREAGDPVPEGGAPRARRTGRRRPGRGAGLARRAGRAEAGAEGAAEFDGGAGMTLTVEHTTMPVLGRLPIAQQPRRAGRAHRRGGAADPDPGPQAGPPRRRRAHRRRLLRHRHPGDPVRRGARTSRPETVDDPERDRFILSKGHVAGALYTTLAAFGFLAGERAGHVPASRCPR